MRKYLLILVLSIFCFARPVLAGTNSVVEKETKDLIKLQSVLEQVAAIVNQMADKFVKDQKFKTYMEGRIVGRLVPWGHDVVTEKRNIDTVVVHSIYDALGNNVHDTDGVMYELGIYDVSSHYLITRNGIIYRLVRDNDLAWHAGKSQLFDGRTSVNKFSIGIEVLYHEKEEPSDIQYQALVDLIKYLKIEHKIKHITGHSNVSLTKKTDPWNFDWIKFNELFNN